MPAWPNVLAVGSRPESGAAGSRGSVPRPSLLSRAMRRGPSGPHSLLSAFAPQLWAAYKPLTRPDLSLLDRCAGCALLPPQHGPAQRPRLQAPLDSPAGAGWRRQQRMRACVAPIWGVPLPCTWAGMAARGLLELPRLSRAGFRRLPGSSCRAAARRLLPAREGEPHARAQRLAAANSAALRRHFCALTCALLAVLEPFCTPLGSSGLPCCTSTSGGHSSAAAEGLSAASSGTSKPKQPWQPHRPAPADAC